MGHGHPNVRDHPSLQTISSDRPAPLSALHQMLKTFSEQTERGLRFSSAAKRYEPKPRPRPRQHRAEHVQSVLGAMISTSLGAHTPAADPGSHSTLTYATNRRIFRADPVLGQQQTEHTISLFVEVGMNGTRETRRRLGIPSSLGCIPYVNLVFDGMSG
jgi:hypothetical protein